MIRVGARQPTEYEVALSFDEISGKSGKGTVVVTNTSKKTLRDFQVSLGSMPVFLSDWDGGTTPEWTVEWRDGGTGAIDRPGRQQDLSHPGSPTP